MSETIDDQTPYRAENRDLPLLSVQEGDLDPHGVFRRYRATHPVIAHEAGGYLVLRYADVERLNKDPRLHFTETAWPEMLGVTEGAVFDLFHYGMFQSNGDVHRRRRSPFNRTFAARLMNETRPAIRALAEELIDRCYADGQMEFNEQFAAPLSAGVTSDRFSF